MSERPSLKALPAKTLFKSGDVLVLFGELFDRGYATGLVEEARKTGMSIIGFTVGRRTEDRSLRALTAEELEAAEANLGGKIINVPLMAGFDLDGPEGQPKPLDVINELTLESWQNTKFDWDHLSQCRKMGAERFKTAAEDAFSKLAEMLPKGRNVHFAHIMAGGVPKAKVFLALANRIYKGTGNRFLSSDAFLESDLGKLILQNFEDVTANTFEYLVEGTSEIRRRIIEGGNEVRYSAYGYHGTEILIDGTYQWQTYSNYTQGYAKKKLEDIATRWWNDGVKTVVYNCPEIRTNSSDIFVGVELPLFALLHAFKKEGGAAWADKQWNACRNLLKEDVSLEDLLIRIDNLNSSATFENNRHFELWPTPNDPELAEVVIATSRDITQMHKDNSALISDYLSSLVVTTTGKLICADMCNPRTPVIWLNHDIVAKQLFESEKA